MSKNKIDYNPPVDRLPGKAIVTRGDKLALLRTLRERAGSTVQAGVNRTILAAIEQDIRRAQKGSAPVRPEAPSRTVSRAEAESGTRSIVAQACAGYKIDLDHYGPLLVRPETSRVVLAHESICALALTSDQARQLAALLEEAADDVDRDTAVREHYANLVKQ